MRIALNILAVILLTSTVSPAIGAEPSAAADTVNLKTVPKYKGRTYEEWVAEYQSELYPAQRFEPLKALIMFGANGKAEEVVAIILELLDGYPPEVIDVIRILRDDQDLEEYQEMVKGSSLPPPLEGYFLDMDDFKLYRAAKLGFYRLSHRTVPQLVQLLEAPSERTTARLIALEGLARWSDSALIKLIPELIARDDQLANSAWTVWNENPDPSSYDATAQKLLELNQEATTLRVIQGLTTKRRSRPGAGIALLQKLRQTTVDPVIIDAINEFLEPIEKPKDSEHAATTQTMTLRQQKIVNLLCV